MTLKGTTCGECIYYNNSNYQVADDLDDDDNPINVHYASICQCTHSPRRGSVGYLLTYVGSGYDVFNVENTTPACPAFERKETMT